MAATAQRISPVYDAIDDEKYDLAIKICDKAIRKAPGSSDVPTLQALKALALCRSGQFQQGYQLATSVKLTRPTDPHCLQAIFLTFKMVHMHDDIIDLYSYAYEKSPGNEEWANHWFMALIRKGDYKAAQQAATKIFKTFKLPKYYLWGIMGYYIQAEGPDKTVNLMLTLCERMLEKAISDNLILDFESLQFILIVLDRQKKPKRALEILQGDLGKLCKVEYEKRIMVVELLVKLEEWDQVEIMSLDLLKENVDDWQVYKILFRVFDEQKTRPEIVSEILATLQNGARVRGPYLAELHLANKSEYGGFLGPKKIVDCIISYFERFGNLLCCFTDLKHLLGGLADNHLELIERLQSYIQKNVTSDDTNQTIKNINALNIIQQVRLQYNVKYEVNALVKLILDFYKVSLCIIVKDERERHPGDGYILMAVTEIINCYVTSYKDTKLLFLCLSLLELGLEHSKFNYLFKIIMVRLLFEIGCSQKAINVALSLDIKQMQFDTLSYLYTSGIEYFGCQPGVKVALSNAQSIYYYNQIETPEMTVQAFKFATMSKIPEFVEFRKRLEYSVQRAISARQTLQVEMMVTKSWGELKQLFATIDLESLAFGGCCPIMESSKLHDNRDFGVLGDGDLMSKIRGHAFPLSGPQLDLWLKCRTLIPVTLEEILRAGAHHHHHSNSYEQELAELSKNELVDPSMCCTLQLLLEMLKAKSTAIEARNIQNLISQLTACWERLLNSMKEKSFIMTLDWCKNLTHLVEAWTVGSILVVLEKDRSWKELLVAQIKSAKKQLQLKAREILAESPSSLKARLFGTPILELKTDTLVVGYAKDNWSTTLNNFVEILDTRLSILNEIK